MKTRLLKKSILRFRKGTSLIEVMIAMGVLAVAVPLVLGAMAQTGGSNLASQAETRSPWIIQSCFDEVQYAMKGESRYIKALVPGEPFGTTGTLALAFGPEGGVLGSVDGGGYSSGVSVVDRKPVRYIAVIRGEEERSNGRGEVKPLSLKITLEYPSSAPAAKRQKIDFYSRIP